MHLKLGLLGGAALTLLIASPASEAAAAVKHHLHHTDPREDRSTQAQLRELREQVRALQARLDVQQSVQHATEAQVQTAQAQASTAQSQAQAAQSTAANAASQIQTLPEVVATQVAAIKPKTDKIHYKGVDITLGGFLEAASIYRSHNLGSDIASPFNNIPYNNVRTGHSDETRFSARQSRVSALVEGNVNTTTHLSFYTELDFQGAAQTANSNESNSYNPRIRHLYGSVDWDNIGQGFGLHLLAGQTWSLLTMNTKGITPRNELTPPQIDAQYVPGFVWARQPQVRLTGDFLDHTLWAAVSVENPQTTFYTTGTPAGAAAGSTGTAAALPTNLAYNIAGSSGFNSANTLSLNHIPDVVAKVAYELKPAGHSIHLEGFGIFTALYDRRNGQDDNIYTGGAGAGAVAQIVPGLVDAQVSALFGKGIGRYGSSQLPDATFRNDGRIEPLTEAIFLGGTTVHATKLLDLYGFAGEEHVDRQPYTTAAGLAYGYGNPLYTNAGCALEGSSACVGNTKLIEQATVGFWQKVYQGPFGRLQFGAQYSYTERHGYSGVGGAPSQSENMIFTSFRYYPF